MSKNIKLGKGHRCCKCRKRMTRKTHAKGFKPKPGRSFFREWDHCRSCGHVQHYEEFRVTPERAEKMREAGAFE